MFNIGFDVIDYGHPTRDDDNDLVDDLLLGNVTLADSHELVFRKIPVFSFSMALLWAANRAVSFDEAAVVSLSEYPGLVTVRVVRPWLEFARVQQVLQADALEASREIGRFAERAYGCLVTQFPDLRYREIFLRDPLLRLLQIRMDREA